MAEPEANLEIQPLADSPRPIQRGRWRRRMLIGLCIFLALVVALIGLQWGLRYWLFHSLPDDAPRIGLSMDGFWLNETGITDASIRHVDMTLDQMLHRRPLPAWSAYRSPLDGLWLCGSGTHPCGSVTGAPGHNAAQEILKTIGEVTSNSP